MPLFSTLRSASPSRDETLSDLEQGKIEFLFLAPEQFGNADTFRALSRLPGRPSLWWTRHIASAPGDVIFRPDYLNLGTVIIEAFVPAACAGAHGHCCASCAPGDL